MNGKYDNGKITFTGLSGEDTIFSKTVSSEINRVFMSSSNPSMPRSEFTTGRYRRRSNIGVGILWEVKYFHMVS